MRTHNIGEETNITSASTSKIHAGILCRGYKRARDKAIVTRISHVQRRDGPHTRIT